MEDRRVDTTDAVNHPSHYHSGKYECIDVMVDVFGAEAVRTFCKLNTFKYIYRHEHKGGDEDIAKAQWYLRKYEELGDEEGGHDSTGEEEQG